jgi:hypothetical protein
MYNFPWVGDFDLHDHSAAALDALSEIFVEKRLFYH